MKISNKLKTVVSQFDGVNLKEMNRVELMNRTDTKFLFRINI